MASTSRINAGFARTWPAPPRALGAGVRQPPVVGRRPKRSDWDLAVIVDDDAPEREVDPVQARHAPRDLACRVDIAPVRLSEFEEAKQYFGSQAQIHRRRGTRDQCPLAPS
jgi:hypothetical protein